MEIRRNFPNSAPFMCTFQFQNDDEVYGFKIALKSATLLKIKKAMLSLREYISKIILIYF